MNRMSCCQKHDCSKNSNCYFEFEIKQEAEQIEPLGTAENHQSLEQLWPEQLSLSKITNQYSGHR